MIGLVLSNLCGTRSPVSCVNCKASLNLDKGSRVSNVHAFDLVACGWNKTCCSERVLTCCDSVIPTYIGRSDMLQYMYLDQCMYAYRRTISDWQLNLS